MCFHGLKAVDVVEFFAEMLKSTFIHLYEKEVLEAGFASPILYLSYYDVGILRICVDLFFDSAHNSFLHELTTHQLFLPVLSSDLNDVITKELLGNAGLLKRIMNHYTVYTEPRGKDAGQYTSYNGYLTMVCNVIVSKDLVSKFGFTSDLPAWNKFVADKLDVQNKLEQQPPDY